METSQSTVVPASVSILKAALWMTGALAFILGMIGVWDRMMHGHIGAAYNNIVVWGLWVANYIFYIGISAGAFLISSLVYVFNLKKFESLGRLALMSALITLFLALLSIVVDIGHMDRAWHILLYANFRSPMAWMIYLYTFYVVIVLVEMWFLLRADFIKGASEAGLRAKIYRLLSFGSRDTSPRAVIRDQKIVKVFAAIGIPVAIMFHGGVGALFAAVAARPHWHSALFPILFLLSALVSGGALLVVVSAIFRRGLMQNKQVMVDLGRLVLGLLLLDVLFQISEFLVAFAGGIPGHVEGLNLAMFGPQSGVFWYVQVLFGIVVPIILLVAPTRKNPILVALACGLIAVGIYGLRLNIVIPGLATEELHGLTSAISTNRISTEYFPSQTEWLVSLAVLGLGILLFGLGEILLPEENSKQGV